MLAATAALRCLPQATAATEFVDRDAARALIDAAVTDDDRAEIARITPIATLLGWIDPGDDLLAEARALSGELVLGLYATAADRLYVVTDDASLTPTSQRTLVHEWVHALQDDSYGLETLRDAVPDDDLDRAAALSAVIEGDAEYTSQRYTQRWFDEAKRRAAADEELSLGGSLGAEVTRGPLLWDLYFPYLYGPAFVRGVVEGTGRPGNGLGGGRSDAADGGPSDAAVGAKMSELYGRLPATSTEILHPERYRAGFRPETVPSPALADVLGPGWTQTFDGTWGEYSTANLIAGFSGASAGGELTVVDGWRGDDLAVWRSPAGGSALVLSTRWADTASAERFAERLRTAMGFEGTAEGTAGGTAGTGAGTWRFADGRTCRVAVDGRASLVTCTDDAVGASALAPLAPEAAPGTAPPR